MDETNLYLDPPRQIINLMRKTFGANYSYYLGSPTYNFPKDAFPLIVVQSVQSSNTIQGAATGTDVVQELIHINFLEESRDYAGASDDTDTALRILYDKIQGRGTDGLYLPSTAMYALRSNLDLGSNATNSPTTIDHDISIDYDIIPQANSPTVVRALITVLTVEHVRVDSRYS